MVEVYKLAHELEVSSIEIIEAMKKLDIPVQLPNPSVSLVDAQKIRASFKKGSGFLFKNGSFFITAVVSMTLLLSINSDKVFADDTPPPAITSSNSTISEPTIYSLPAFKDQAVVASKTIRDSFTVMVQEKLIDLGLFSGPATGDNDQSTQQAIKSFQKKAGLEKIDGMVGPETLPKLLLGEAAYTTTAPLTSNSNGPVWGDDQLQFMRVNGTYMDVLWGHVTHDNPIDTFQLYVDGELHSTLDANACINSCSSTSGDMRFKIDGLAVDTTYEFEVVACDGDGNCSTNNPTTTQSTVDKPPVWDESLPLTVSEIGTRFNLNIPFGAVTDDIQVSYYEVYVNGALATFRTISDIRLFVSPKNDMTCGQQEVYIIAYDTIGQSSKSPTTTTTTTTTLPGTPSMTITASEVSDGDTSSDSALSLTFTASASTTDFAVGDISVSGGTLSNFSGSGTTYTATFTPTAQGATTIDVASSTFTNASTSTDNTAATQFNWTYSTAPTIAITASEVSDGATSSDSALSLTFTASQSTTNFAAGDVVVSGGTLSNFSGSGTTYTATFTPSAAGATTIDVAGGTFTNAFSTNNTAATQFNWTYSPAPPTMTITAAEVNDGDTSNDTSLSVTFTASQSTTNFTAGDVVVSGGTLSNFSGSGTTYTATFTPSAEGATTIDITANSFTNAFSTNNTAATQFNWTYSTASASTTSANRWVIAVIDETMGAYTCGGNFNAMPSYMPPGPMHNGNCDVDGAWGEFRTLWPNRKFFLIEPWENTSDQVTDFDVSSLNPSIDGLSHIKLPAAFVTEAQAGEKAVYIQSTRNTGGTNWWSEIGGSSLPSGAEVILWVDNSGSLTTGKVQAEYNAFISAAAAANVTVTEVTNLTSEQGGSLLREDWINPFDPDYP